LRFAWNLKENGMSKVYAVAFAGLVALAGACGDDNPITNLSRGYDCSKICEQLNTCVNLNEDDCNEDCTNMKSDEETDRISDCADCLDDKSCTEGFQCAVECSPLNGD
jgi:hypothetical protein